MKEIGGYFGLEKLISHEYHHDLIALNTGKNALLYLLKSKNIKKLYIPYYLCYSISELLKEENYCFQYYSIDSQFNPIFDQKMENDEYLLIVNYYGQFTDEKILSLKSKYKNIIVDNIQAFFQRPIKDIFTIYSCRKFFGVPDGAYLATDTRLEEDLETDLSKGRMTHMLGRFEGRASDYFNDFKKNEALLKNDKMKQMSRLTHNILGAIPYEEVRTIRNHNFKFLDQQLRDLNQLKLILPEGAFAYPFQIEKGMMIRKNLAEKKIYIPILWPNVLQETPEDSIEYRYSADILPLPCDQRYDIEDMRYIVDALLSIK